MKSFFKFLSRNKLYTFIEVFGLAVALMFILIIAKYTDEKTSTDKFHENAENIYALASENYIGSGYGLSNYLLDRYPEIERICAVGKFGTHGIEVYDQKYSLKSMAVDTTFLKMFSFSPDFVAHISLKS